jgi:prepilin-type N-terminal cleavage/methylation domain-containing protein
MSRARREGGFTLVELLLAMTLMLVVMTATIAVFATMERGTHDNQTLNDTQEHARVATDTLMRRLRNLANTDTTTVQQPLVRAEAQDLVFKTTNADATNAAGAIELYRYCLSATDQKLYVQRLTSTSGAPAMPSTTACPGTGWPAAGQGVVADHVVNGARPVFLYQVSPTPGTYTEQSSVPSSSFPTDIAIRSQLWLDLDTTRAPLETSLTSRVFLRNQNRPPVAALDLSKYAKTVTFNASASTDPENYALSYRFVDGTTSVPASGTACVVASSTTCGWGSAATYSFTPSAGTHTFWVQLKDAGGLIVDSTKYTVTCTSGATGACS